MAIENINAHGNLITFTDRDSSDFTATVALSREELLQLVAAAGIKLAPTRKPYTVQELTVAGALGLSITAWAVVYQGKAYGFGDGAAGKLDAENMADQLVEDIDAGTTYIWDEWPQGTERLRVMRENNAASRQRMSDRPECDLCGESHSADHNCQDYGEADGMEQAIHDAEMEARPKSTINRTLWEMEGKTKAERHHPGSQHHFAAGRCTLGRCTHTEDPKPEEETAACTGCTVPGCECGLIPLPRLQTC
jgi:hypothetical protein